MNGWTLEQIAAWSDGALDAEAARGNVVPFGQVSIDSRSLPPGAVFVAVRGLRDGHDFVADAAGRGASAAIVERGRHVEAPAGFPLIRVEDPLGALWRWAEAHRKQMRARRIAVTGSSGKTTTKDRISEALAREHAVHATEGNRNNQLGVPLTLLSLRPEHAWSVIEIATNHPGEIEPLARLVQPDHLVLTTVGWAHVGAFGSREEILREKLSALCALAPGGLLFHDADPWLAGRLDREAGGVERRSFGLEQGADCRPGDLEWEWDETRLSIDRSGPIRYRCPGRGPCRAALAAALVGRTLGLAGGAIRDALESARPRPLRMQPCRLGPARALLDCYNASPESSREAVRFLLSLPPRGRRWLAFGEMRELGARSAEEHRRLGEEAAGFDGAFLFGEGCRPVLEGLALAGAKTEAALFPTREELALSLAERLERDDLVLFKGSRGSEMERAFALCRDRLARGG